jgi:hypothetical protein
VVFPCAIQRGQACLSIPIIFHPYKATARLVSPSYQARPSVMRFPVSPRREFRRCSMYRTPCGLQMSQNRNVRVDTAPPSQVIFVSTLLHNPVLSTRADGRTKKRSARFNYFAFVGTVYRRQSLIQTRTLRPRRPQRVASIAVEIQRDVFRNEQESGNQKNEHERYRIRFRRIGRVLPRQRYHIPGG